MPQGFKEEKRQFQNTQKEMVGPEKKIQGRLRGREGVQGGWGRRDPNQQPRKLGCCGNQERKETQLVYTLHL